MRDDPVSIETRRGVATVRLNRPDQINALSPDVVDGLAAAIETVEADESVRVVVLTGSGSAFSAGGDLKEFRARIAAGEQHIIVEGLHRMMNLLRRIETSGRPYVAAVNGVAVAGGLELILCCDLVFAAESAKLGDGHLKFGVVPGAGSSVRLPRKVPRNVANRLLLTGELVSAAQMQAWGLVNEVVPDADLVGFTADYAARIACLSPQGLACIKNMIGSGLEQSIDVALTNEISAFDTYSRCADFLEGVTAFAERRAPRFTGR